MKYTIDTDRYNDRRYGKPWIARVVGKEFAWGEWEGRPGEAGKLRIDAEPGDLVAEGQKDLRKGRGGVNQYYMAMPSGKLWGDYLNTESRAREWSRKGWREYAEYRLNDQGSSNAVRLAAAKMLGVQAPFITAAAELFGLVEGPKPTRVEASMDAFGF